MAIATNSPYSPLFLDTYLPFLLGASIKYLQEQKAKLSTFKHVTESANLDIHHLMSHNFPCKLAITIQNLYHLHAALCLVSLVSNRMPIAYPQAELRVF